MQAATMPLDRAPHGHYDPLPQTEVSSRVRVQRNTDGQLDPTGHAAGFAEERLLEIMNYLAAAGAITTRSAENLIACHDPKGLPDGATTLCIGGILKNGTLDFLKQPRTRGYPVQVP